MLFQQAANRARVGWFLGAGLLIFWHWNSPAVAEDKPAIVKAYAAIAACQEGRSNAETSACYGNFLNELTDKVQLAQKKRFTDLANLPAKNYGGARNIRRFQTAGRNARRQWKALIANECGPLSEMEFYGGQGQSLFAQLCRIKLLSAQLDALTSAGQ
jgi:hypothetical protein